VALAAAFAVLEDRAQPPQSLGVLALQPRASADGLAQPVGQDGGMGLERELHAGGATGHGRQLVDPECADAIGLAGTTDLHDPVGAGDLGEGGVPPAEAVAGRLHAKAGAGAATDGVLPREVPVDQVMVGELGVIGNVLQVVEDLLARGADDDRNCDGVHGAAV
jgi:hypothetical protein